MGDADAAQFLTSEDNGREALVQLGIAELWEDALWDLCQHSTCKEACRNEDPARISSAVAADNSLEAVKLAPQQEPFHV